MKGLQLGQTATVSRVFTADHLVTYRRLADDGGLRFHVSDSAENHIPGPLLAGMFSDLMGTQLPGRGTNWLKQRLTYPAPAYLDEALTATVEIIRLRPEKELVNLRTTVTNAAGEIVCLGEALVLVKNLESHHEHQT